MTETQGRPLSIPEFFWDALVGLDVSAIAESVAISYEQGTGGEITTVIGTVIEPLPRVTRIFPDCIWILPHRDQHGKQVQQEDRASILQINRRFIVEMGTVITPEDVNAP